mmetsp:Transcript_26374/g.60941  ORF Transcript_26374/g.60941 Transcript_26374/m.60941 type:complete len:207 (-) Transcript_26374:155-775(-)
MSTRCCRMGMSCARTSPPSIVWFSIALSQKCSIGSAAAPSAASVPFTMALRLAASGLVFSSSSFSSSRHLRSNSSLASSCWTCSALSALTRALSSAVEPAVTVPTASALMPCVTTAVLAPPLPLPRAPLPFGLSSSSSSSSPLPTGMLKLNEKGAAASPTAGMLKLNCCAPAPAAGDAPLAPAGLAAVSASSARKITTMASLVIFS